MSYALTVEETAVQEKARRLVDRLIPYEVEAEMNEGVIDSQIEAAFEAEAKEQGLSAINLSVEHGGPGYSTMQQVLIQEQTGRVTNALGWLVSTGPGWLGQVASPYLIERYLLPIAAGDMKECYAITEPEAGSDVDAIAATANRQDDVYILNGRKLHVTSANLANCVFFQAKLANGPHTGSHAMFVFDMDTPGVRCLRVPAYTHTYAHHHWDMSFDDVEVPATHRIGEEGDGMGFAYEWFRYERLMIAARCCGAAERLIDEASAFAAERIAFGQPIGHYQAIQFMLADSVTELWAARLMTYQTARAIDAGVDGKVAHAQTSMAKLYASEMANRVADRAVQIFGGRGYMRENVAERFFRELRVDRIWEGSSEIQRVIIGDQLAKRGVRRLSG